MPREQLIQLRCGTASQWTLANPVLELGEPGLETDTRKVKHGDGTTVWNALGYAEAAASAPSNMVTTDTDQTITGYKTMDLGFAVPFGSSIDFAGGNASITTDNTSDFPHLNIAASRVIAGSTLFEGSNRVYSAANLPPAPANMVTTDTDQTITGAKEFTAPQGLYVTDVNGEAAQMKGSGLYLTPAQPPGIGATPDPALYPSQTEIELYPWTSSTANASVALRAVVDSVSPNGRWRTNVPIYENDNRVYSAANLPPAPSNMVTTDTDQTITGAKTFIPSILVEGADSTATLSTREADFTLSPTRWNGVASERQFLYFSAFAKASGSPEFSIQDDTGPLLWAVRSTAGAPPELYEGTNRVYSAANPPPATAPSNMVTTDTDQTITSLKTISRPTPTSSGLDIRAEVPAGQGIYQSPYLILRPSARAANGDSTQGITTLWATASDASANYTQLRSGSPFHAPELWDNDNRVYSAANLPPTDTSRIASTEKGVANGVATLGSDSKIPSSQLPALAITDTFVVANQNAMLALTAEIGDVAVRSDLNKSFILRVAGAGTLSNWQELLTPTDAVLSVNSQTGAVVLTAANVGAVATTGNETIAGAKTFSSTPIVPDSSFNISKLSATGTKDATTFLRGDNTFAVPTVNAPSNMVTTDTFQTITGQKYFTGNVGYPGGAYASVASVQSNVPATSVNTLRHSPSVEFAANWWDGSASLAQYGYLTLKANAGRPRLEVLSADLYEGSNRVYSAGNKVPLAGLSATGTADATTFLRGDNTWAAPTAATALTVTPVTAAHTAVAGSVVLANGTFTVTLPTPVSGSQIAVKNTGTGTITIVGTVDGTTTTVLASQYQSITVVSDGTAYYNI